MTRSSDLSSERRVLHLRSVAKRYATRTCVLRTSGASASVNGEQTQIQLRL